MQEKKIVCLGGGVGTSNLLRGLKKLTNKISVITSMADDGGSSGRLRKAYKIMPPGDIVISIAALIPDGQEELASLLLYRFSGESRINKIIDGHKLGNLIMLAEMQRTGSFYKSIEVTKKIFGVTANFFPATDERVQLSAITRDGRRVHSETTLDLALYSEPHGLRKVYITPAKPKVNPRVAESILSADIIFSGPGDLYTNQLPVLIVPQIKEALLQSKAKKVFILNIANKPFETKGFGTADFVQAIRGHLGTFPFSSIIANGNYSVPIPTHYNYTYVQPGKTDNEEAPSLNIIVEDVVNESFPLYHDPVKLAKILQKII